MVNPFEYHALASLRDVKQYSDVDFYYSYFDFQRVLSLCQFPGICDAYFLSRFINGLQSEIQVYVLQHHPANLLDAYNLASVKEYSIKCTKKPQSPIEKPSVQGVLLDEDDECFIPSITDSVVDVINDPCATVDDSIVGSPSVIHKSPLAGHDELLASVKEVSRSAAIPVSSALMDGFSFVDSNANPKSELITYKNEVLALCTDKKDAASVVTSITTSSIYDVAIPLAAAPNTTDVHTDIVVHLPFSNTAQRPGGNDAMVASISFIPDYSVNNSDLVSIVLVDAPGCLANSALSKAIPAVHMHSKFAGTQITPTINEVIHVDGIEVVKPMVVQPMGSLILLSSSTSESSEGSLVPRCVSVFKSTITDDFHQQLHCSIVTKTGASAAMYVQCFDPGISTSYGDNVRPQILEVGRNPEKCYIAWMYQKFVLALQFDFDLTELLAITMKDSLYRTVEFGPALNQFVYFYNAWEEILQMEQGIPESKFSEPVTIILVSYSTMIIASCGNASTFLCHGTEWSSSAFSGIDIIYVKNKVSAPHISAWHNRQTYLIGGEWATNMKGLFFISPLPWGALKNMLAPRNQRWRVPRLSKDVILFIQAVMSKYGNAGVRYIICFEPGIHLPAWSELRLNKLFFQAIKDHASPTYNPDECIIYEVWQTNQFGSSISSTYPSTKGFILTIKDEGSTEILLLAFLTEEKVVTGDSMEVLSLVIARVYAHCIEDISPDSIFRDTFHSVVAWFSIVEHAKIQEHSRKFHPLSQSIGVELINFWSTTPPDHNEDVTGYKFVLNALHVDLGLTSISPTPARILGEQVTDASFMSIIDGTIFYYMPGSFRKLLKQAPRVANSARFIDYDKLDEKALEFLHKLVIFGGNDYPRDWDSKKFRHVADKSMTRNSLRGPRAGMIFCSKGPKPTKNSLPKDDFVPALQGVPDVVLNFLALILCLPTDSATRTFSTIPFKSSLLITICVHSEKYFKRFDALKFSVADSLYILLGTDSIYILLCINLHIPCFNKYGTTFLTLHMDGIAPSLVYNSLWDFHLSKYIICFDPGILLLLGSKDHQDILCSMLHNIARMLVVVLRCIVWSTHIGIVLLFTKQLWGIHFIQYMIIRKGALGTSFNYRSSLSCWYYLVISLFPTLSVLRIGCPRGFSTKHANSCIAWQLFIWECNAFFYAIEQNTIRDVPRILKNFNYLSSIRTSGDWAAFFKAYFPSLS